VRFDGAEVGPVPTAGLRFLLAVTSAMMRARACFWAFRGKGRVSDPAAVAAAQIRALIV
jgi:hypothetical protein